MYTTNINIAVEKIFNNLLQQHQIQLNVLRLDAVHPIVSGNKLFKLHYFFETLLPHQSTTVITFGGAYSNHLVATAYYCQQKNLACIGYVRGEAASTLSHTLLQCKQYGMQLIFLSRAAYAQKNEPDFIEKIISKYTHYLIIPEGGYHPLGAKGAALIMNSIDATATHICTAIGTATTIAGLLLKAAPTQQIIGMPVLKNVQDVYERIAYLTNNIPIPNLFIAPQYHFGGYAKKNAALINFMNQLYATQQLPTDFVYTAKMMFGVFDLIEKNHFAPGSNIVCIHTGGLQGNASLPKNTLTF